MNADNRKTNDGQECCGSGDCACNSKDQRGGGIRTAAFIVVILAALGVTGYSLFFKSTDAGKAGCVPGAVPAPSESLSTLPELNAKLGDLDFVYILMNDGDFATEDNIPTLVDSALTETGAEKAAVIRLTPGDPVFNQVADKYIITGFPAVLSLGRYGERLLIRSGITVETLKLAHKIAATPPAPCCG